jgi:hypothetical protein
MEEAVNGGLKVATTLRIVNIGFGQKYLECFVN